MEKYLREAITVLVVEDNADAREIFAYALSSSGYQIVEASNGKDALHKLGLHLVDIIVTDLRMPVMDGLHMAAAIRDTDHLAHIPLIALTATPLVNKADMLPQFAALLTKPCSIDELVGTVDKIVIRYL
ncbi:response regulator [Herbaspirillum robiniae]|uniref:Response regulator n=1 Tax=Herbaspirillum robiniae TaxID=2014887 RepID=A0ABX2LV00_9BURK|nr:response regulator [Herbaspirillum robiniae]NUU01568.1 response regulator [Herbaspirillum robiniae]